MFLGSQPAAVFYPWLVDTFCFHTGAIQLSAGVIYSVGLVYKGGFNWSDFSILIGTSQSTVGLSNLASTGQLSFLNQFTPLSNTFAVPSGIYYVAVKAIGNGNSVFDWLIWDDLSITIPCIPANTPTVAIAASSTTLCTAEPLTSLTFTASGADTYVWGSGVTTSITSAWGPPGNTNFMVTGTDAITGCTNSAVMTVTFYPSPTVSITASSPSICPGSTVQLTAGGTASSYTWSGGQQSSTISDSPTLSTTYSVVGTGANGCSLASTYLVAMKPVPVITYTSSATTATICNGDEVTITAGGASNYDWNWPTGAGVGSTLQISPYVTGTVNIKGTATNGCSSSTDYVLYVNTCTGLTHNTKSNGIEIYPNPGQGEYLIETESRDLKSILVTDFMGKIVFSSSSSEEIIPVDIKNLSEGIYQLRITSGGETNDVKIIKE